MSASQARLLSLTARQSNLEFEGQQINQQRTNLSNQSANYYNSLLTMTVPTPPSTDDYTTVKYSFVIGGNDATIAQVLPQDDKGNYLVEYTTNLASIGVQENSAYKITASANGSTTKTGTKTQVTDPTEAYNADMQYYVQTFREDDLHGQLTAITNASDRYDDARLDGNATYYDKYGNQVDKADAVDAAGKLKDEYTALVTKESDEMGFSVVNIQLADRASYQEALDRGEIVNKFVENTIDTPNDQKGTDEVITYAASNDATFSTVGSEYKEAFLNAGLDSTNTTNTNQAPVSDLQKKTTLKKVLTTLHSASLLLQLLL